MKLRPPYLLGRNYTAIRRAIIRDSGHTSLIIWLNIKRVGEVKVRFWRDIGEDGLIRVQRRDRIPAHVRDLRTMGNAPHLTMEKLEPINLALGMVFRQQLHTQTDAQK